MKSLAAFLVLAVIWLAGLFAFADRVQRSTPPPTPEPADGIVVLTGPESSERMPAAVNLLVARLGRRVLVSGVNRGVTRDQLRAHTGAVKRVYDCCVDLGFAALDTVGNARETAEWARQLRYSSLIVVTSDYHMPRAMLELRAIMRPPAYHLQTYAVPTSMLQHRWWRSPAAARLMVVEYCKYLAILGREAVLGLGPRAKPAAAQKAPA